MKNYLICFFLMFCALSSGQNSNLPKEIELVFDFMVEEDPPELFNENPYQPRPMTWQIIDIDEDGVIEVFLQTFPHYRQSPTITIYQIHQKDSVSRITEGLAPGPLVELSQEQDFFDPHTTGKAADMQLGSKAPEALDAFAKSSLKFGLSTVLYKNFIHTDKRDGNPVFLDLTYLNDFTEVNSCEGFQFALPESIIAGHINNSKYKYLVAKVMNELYCYKIIGFNKIGRIRKQIQIIDLPVDFKSLQVENQNINYVSNSGNLKPLPM